MADNMCGPSNGAKNLLSHADRDRSLYQDRVIGAPNGGNQVCIVILTHASSATF